MNPKIEEKLKELRAVEQGIHVLHQEIGELVAAELGVVVRPPGKMLVSGPAPSATVPSIASVLDAVGAANGSAAAGPVRVAQKDIPAEGVESLPKRLENLLNTNPGRTFTADEAATALGEEPRKTHYTLLRRMARNNKIKKVGRGTFRAKQHNGGRKAS